MEPTQLMFSSRLLRKAYRPERRHQGCPADVFQCEEEFMALVKQSETTQPMDRGEWHRLCNEFSDKWEHICHWVHPSRLADFLTENLELEWVGEYPIRPETKSKSKVKSNVKAQRFKCSECDVVCNSYAQYVIHSQGSRHKECVEYKVHTEILKGNIGYKSPGAIPLDTNAQCDEEGNVNLQAYYRKDENTESGSECGSNANSSGSNSGKKRLPSAASRARMFCMTAMMAMSMPSVSYENSYQGDAEYYEQPSTNNYGWWGTDYGTGPYQTLVEPTYQDDGEAGEEVLDDDEEEGQQPYFYLNPSAKSFMSRSQTLPLYDQDEVSSSMESTPAPSSGGTDIETDVQRLVSMIEQQVSRGERTNLKTLTDDDDVVSKALVGVSVSTGNDKVRAILDGHHEMKEMVGADVRERIAKGVNVMEVDEFMCDEEAEHVEDAGNRELMVYSCLLALGVSLFMDNAFGAEDMSSMLVLFTKNLSGLVLPVAADEQIGASFKVLKTHPDAKELSIPVTEAMPRRLRAHCKTLMSEA
eukprot:TRINITY_DN2053_c2_g4_i1.p1 TRINITY_DN2053_c2_g4~~TRINITY_DN2053_c2_g4_i1.p1  ORF type:complete len:546 (+),score=191.09 TRINITY_DN2053_c2_g4_i1:57-1640(+)